MRHNLKRVFCLLLALLMAAGVTACGEKPQEAQPTEAPEEYVYAAQFAPLENSPENGLSAMGYSDDGIYAQTWEKVGEREKPEDVKIRYEGEYDIYGSALYFVGFDGSVKRLENYRGVPVPEDGEDRTDYTGSSSLSRVFVNADGTITALESQYISWYDGPESERYGDNQWEYQKNEQHYYIRTLDSTGAEQIIGEIVNPDEDSWMDFYNAQLDAAGNLICAGEMKLLVFAPDGTLSSAIPCDNYPDSLVKLPDGRIAVTMWGENGVEMYFVDVEKGELGEGVKVPRNAYNFLTGGGEYDLYYQNGMNLYGFNLGDTDGTRILNWINADVNPDQLGGMNIREDGSVIGILTNWSGEKVTSELMTLSLVPASSLPKKQTLTLAVMYLDYQVQQKLIDFNRHSDTTRIEVLDYFRIQHRGGLLRGPDQADHGDHGRQHARSRRALGPAAL